MALDHYVPQVHLRRFLSPALGVKLLYAIRKSNGARFSPRTQDVCRIDEGSTNAYLGDPRAIEDFLRNVEPKYNAAVDALQGGATDGAHIAVLAGFVAYTATCSPAAMRTSSELLRHAVEAAAEIMDRRGLLPPAPEMLGGARLPELVRDERVQINVDPKFPQSIGIAQILELQRGFESCDWEFLHAPTAKSFLTSDFPAAIEGTKPGRPVSRIVPLSPELAVRIVPGRTVTTRKPETSAIGGRRHRSVGGHEVVGVNTAIVRCAEDIVFFRDDAPWVGLLVDANRDYRVVPVSRRVQTGRGSALKTSLTVGKRADK